MEKAQIGLYGAVSLISTAILSKLFLTFIPRLVEKTGTATYIAVLIALMSASLAFFLFYRLISRFGGNTLSEILKLVTGNVLGRIITFLIGLYFIFYSAYYIRGLSDIICHYPLPKTPLYIMSAVFVFLSAAIASKGIEALCRISSFLFSFILFSILFILVFSYVRYLPAYLTPFLGYGIFPILKEGVENTSLFFDIFILAIVANSTQNRKTFRRAGIISLAVSGGMSVISLLCYSMAFHYKMGAEALSGMFEISQAIYFGRVFARFSSVVSITTTLTSIILCSLAVYCAIRLICESLPLNFAPLSITCIIAAIVYTLSMIPVSIINLIEFYLPILKYTQLVLLFVLPVLLIVLSHFTKGGRLHEK